MIDGIGSAGSYPPGETGGSITGAELAIVLAAQDQSALAAAVAEAAMQAIGALGADVSAALTAAFAAQQQSQLMAGQLQSILLAETYVPKRVPPEDWEHSGAWYQLQTVWDYLTNGLTTSLQSAYDSMQAIAQSSYY